MAKKSKRRGRTKGKGAANGSGGSYVSPGVYIEEVPSSSKPIEGVGTAVAAFVGLAESGPPGVIWRRAGALVLLVTGAAAGVWAWQHRAGRR